MISFNPKISEDGLPYDEISIFTRRGMSNYDDYEAWDRILTVCHTIARRIIRKSGNCPRHQDVEDLAQEASLKISKGNYNFSRPALPWIFSIVKGTYVDSIRRMECRIKPLSLDYVPHEKDQQTETLAGKIIDHREQSPDYKTERDDAIKYVQDAIGQLGPDEQNAIMDSYFRDLSDSQLSLINRIPLGTIKSRGNRARKFLRYQLEPHLEELIIV
ncbi:hypothetical protein COU60_02015 [Candidatus Pacearchaeota archaeon CG10_big_fil_rev_8_21_14_0_10_34_76]|nr:MAG: hypothetical protein COU60_02015 [Candidatus Pacearchaeota archaeon CG10_big_fil_rev_8_21_14_0_10_34_76]